MTGTPHWSHPLWWMGGDWSDKRTQEKRWWLGFVSMVRERSSCYVLSPVPSHPIPSYFPLSRLWLTYWYSSMILDSMYMELYGYLKPFYWFVWYGMVFMRGDTNQVVYLPLCAVLIGSVYRSKWSSPIALVPVNTNNICRHKYHIYSVSKVSHASRRYSSSIFTWSWSRRNCSDFMI